jgi:ubiquinone/menaquinone biosynthesis C-methylase UbiE
MPGHPVVAALYDRMIAAGEKAGLRDMRAGIVSEARGRTLELGAGTGHNLAHYTDAVSELVLTEPDPHMARRLRGKLNEQPPAPASFEVVETGAEKLPFEDGSFDTVVATLVLCTIPDPEAAASEIARVLKSGGRLLFLEHVRGESGSATERWQDRLERPWGWIAAGCHPNRDTEALLERSSLQIERVEHTTMPGPAPPVVRPVIVGSAAARSG